MRANIPVQKGEVIEINITGLGSSGEGVGKYQGFTVFVPGALPTETVKAKVGLVKKSYATAKIVEILEASAERVEPACPVYKECGGCQLQHLSYAGQLQMKKQQVRDALTRIGHLDTEVLPVIGCANPWNYRNKMQFPAAMGAEGKIEIGCYATATHSVVDTEGCLIQRNLTTKCWLPCVSGWKNSMCLLTMKRLAKV